MTRLIPPGEPPQQVPVGAPRVHWLEADEREPDVDLVPPYNRLMAIDQVSVRTSADGNGDVWIIYTLAT